MLSSLQTPLEHFSLGNNFAIYSTLFSISSVVVFWVSIYSALIKCLSILGTKLVGVKDKINQTLTLSSKKFLFAYGDKIWITNVMQGEVIMFPQGWI